MSPRSRDNRVSLIGVKLRPRIGVTAGERRQPQRCDADVTVWGDFEAAVSADSLEQAIDYTKVLSAVLETAHAQEHNLLETLAYRLARAVLRTVPARRVGVRVRKRPVSLMEKLDYIEVELEES